MSHGFVSGGSYLLSTYFVQFDLIIKIKCYVVEIGPETISVAQHYCYLLMKR